MSIIARFPPFIVGICYSIVRNNQMLDWLIISLVWYTLKQLFTPVSVKMVDIYLDFGE